VAPAPRRGGLVRWLRRRAPGAGRGSSAPADPNAERSQAPPSTPGAATPVPRPPAPAPPGEASIGRRTGTSSDRERDRDTAASQGGRPDGGTEEAFRIDAARARLKARIPPKAD
jgi:hypothetical protein